MTRFVKIDSCPRPWPLDSRSTLDASTSGANSPDPAQDSQASDKGPPEETQAAFLHLCTIRARASASSLDKWAGRPFVQIIPGNFREPLAIENLEDPILPTHHSQFGKLPQSVVGMN